MTSAYFIKTHFNIILSSSYCIRCHFFPIQLTHYLHGASSILRNSENTLPLKEPEGSSLCSQEPTSVVPILSQMRSIHTFRHYFCKIHSNIIPSLHLGRSRDSSVSIVTKLRAGRPDFDSRYGQGIFLFATVSRLTLSPIQPSIQWVPGALSTDLHLVPRLIEPYLHSSKLLHGVVLS